MSGLTDYAIRRGLTLLAAFAYFILVQQVAFGDDPFSFERLEEMEAEIEAVAPPGQGDDATGKTPADDDLYATEKTVTVDETPLASRMESPRAMNMWRSLGSLLLVLGALLLVNRWLRGRLPARLGSLSSRRMCVQERLTIDHRRQLVLVSVDGRELVVALGPNQIEAIAQWKREAPPASPGEPVREEQA